MNLTDDIAEFTKALARRRAELADVEAQEIDPRFEHAVVLAEQRALRATSIAELQAAKERIKDTRKAYEGARQKLECARERAREDVVRAEQTLEKANQELEKSQVAKRATLRHYFHRCRRIARFLASPDTDDRLRSRAAGCLERRWRQLEADRSRLRELGGFPHPHELKEGHRMWPVLRLQIENNEPFALAELRRMDPEWSRSPRPDRVRGKVVPNLTARDLLWIRFGDPTIDELDALLAARTEAAKPPPPPTPVIVSHFVPREGEGHYLWSDGMRTATEDREFANTQEPLNTAAQ